MKPITPIVKGLEDLEIVFAKDQPEYLPLPVLPVESGMQIVTRWRLDWRERLRVLFSGDLYLWVMTFGKPLQPVMLEANRPQITRASGEPPCICGTVFEINGPCLAKVHKARSARKAS